MPEPIPFNLTEAQLADGTIDFYAMLVETPDSGADVLRAKIQALYTEAQANRDHRNLTKRKEYQALLELLPDARTVLLDDTKRGSYDTYLAASKSGTASPDFETFMNDLMELNQPLEAKTGLLGYQDKAEATARVVKAPKEAAATPKKKTVAPVAPAGPAPLAIGGGVLGLILGVIVGQLLLHSLIPAVLAGILIGAVVFLLLNNSPRGRVKI